MKCAKLLLILKLSKTFIACLKNIMTTRKNLKFSLIQLFKVLIIKILNIFLNDTTLTQIIKKEDC